MGFTDDAKRGAAASDRSKLRSEAAKGDALIRELLEAVGKLEDEMKEVKARLERLKNPSDS